MTFDTEEVDSGPFAYAGQDVDREVSRYMTVIPSKLAPRLLITMSNEKKKKKKPLA